MLMSMKELCNKMNQSVEMLNNIWQYAKDNNLENYQEVLQWLDTINEISIRN